MLLASKVEGFSQIYFIRQTEHKEKWEGVACFLKYAFSKEEGIFKDYIAWKPEFILLDPNIDEKKIKDTIIKQLEKDEWLTKPTTLP
jgi:hypothetical protein